MLELLQFKKELYKAGCGETGGQCWGTWGAIHNKIHVINFISFLSTTSSAIQKSHKKTMWQYLFLGLEPPGRGLQRWGLHALDKPLGSDKSPECSRNQGTTNWHFHQTTLTFTFELVIFWVIGGHGPRISRGQILPPINPPPLPASFVSPD